VTVGKTPHNPDKKQSKPKPSPSQEKVSIESLVARSREGDMQAFGELVAKYSDRVYNLTFRMCGRRADAEELTQETFLKALERISQFRGNSHFYTWLFRIAANLTISHRRRRSRVKFHSMNDSEDGSDAKVDLFTMDIAKRRTPRPDSAAMSDEISSKISAALDELDDEFRIAVLLRDVEGLDYADIAKVLNVPVGTVKSRLHRARLLLRGKLASLMH